MRRVTVVGVALAWVFLAPALARGAPPIAERKVTSRVTASVVRVDLDGDGVDEECRLTHGSHLVVTSGTRGPRYERPMPAKPAGGSTLRVHQVRGVGGAPVAVIEARVPLRSPAGAEEVVLLAGWPVRELFAGRVGPMGRDAEWRRYVAVSAQAITQYQRSAHVTRCDGAPTFLYPQVYDFKTGRFEPQDSAAPPPAPRRVTAQRQPPAGAPAGPPVLRFFVSGASSVVNDEGSAANLTPPLGLTDGKLETAWVAGAARGGRGQFVTMRGSPSQFRVKALRIVPGHGQSAAAYRHYDRLHRVQLIFDRAAAVGVDFPREVAGPGGHGVAYWVALPEPVASGCVTMLVESTFPGRAAATPAGGRVAVAEVTVYTEADFGVQIIDRLVADLASGAGGEDVKRLVVAQGPAAEKPLLAALPNATGSGRALVVEALADVATPAAAEALARALDAGGREHAAAARALSRLGDVAVPALAAILADRGAPRPLRARVAAQLGRIGREAAVRALLGALPGAPDNLRDAVAGALRERPVAGALSLVVEQLAGAADAPQRADLLRAVAITAATAGAESRGRAADAVAALAPRAQGFEERFRMAAACGALRDARLAPVLGRLLSSVEPEVREAVVTAASDLTAAAATPLLRRALKDGSPEVRRAAATGVGRRRDVPLAAEVADTLTNDRWPLVRREAATALAERCSGEASLTHLRRAIGDADREVARTALRALVPCRDPQAARILLGVLRDSKRPALLRETAAGAFGSLADRRVVPELARLLDEIRTEPGTDDRGESLTVTLARSLGRIGDERALPALRQASVDPASGRIRAAALEAIAAICPAGATKVFKEAEADKDHRVVGAARAAQARCRR